MQWQCCQLAPSFRWSVLLHLGAIHHGECPGTRAHQRFHPVFWGQFLRGHECLPKHEPNLHQTATFLQHSLKEALRWQPDIPLPCHQFCTAENAIHHRRSRDAIRPLADFGAAVPNVGDATLKKLLILNKQLFSWLGSHVSLISDSLSGD